MDEGQTKRYRPVGKRLAVLCTVISILLVIFLFFYNLGLLSQPPVYLQPLQTNVIGTAVILIIIFLRFPAKKGQSLSWLDLGLLVCGLVPTTYLVINYSQKLTERIESNVELLFATVLLISILEATRRVAGLVISLIGLIFFLYPMLGEFFPGLLRSRPFSFLDITEKMYFSTMGVFGMFMDIGFQKIFGFMLLAAFLGVTGGGKLFTELALSLTGRWRGGAAKAAVVGSSLMGTITGSTVANVASTGVFTIPLMKSTGYRPHIAAAIEACSSCGAQLMPPVMGMVAFVMADLLNISYWKVCLTALAPAALFYLVLFVQVDFEAAKDGLKGLPREELPRFSKVLLKRGHMAIPIFVLIFFLGYLNYSASTGSLYAVLSLVLISFIRKETRLNFQRVIKGMEDTAYLLIDVTVICAVMSMMGAAILWTGLGPNIAGLLVDLAGGNLHVLLITCAIASYILGFALSTVTTYLVLALLVAPALIQTGVDPILAHLFMLYWGNLSNLTPPVAPAPYVAAAIARAPMQLTAWSSMRLGIILYLLPFAFVYDPALVLKGDTIQVIIALIRSIIWAVFIASAVSGYLFGPVKRIERILFAGAAVALAYPAWIAYIIATMLAAPAIIQHTWALRVSRAMGAR